MQYQGILSFLYDLWGFIEKVDVILGFIGALLSIFFAKKAILSKNKKTDIFAKVVLGLIIGIVIASGSVYWRVTKVPDVTGKSISDAKERLEDKDLKCDYDKNSKLSEAKVINQIPEAGKLVLKDTTVTLYLESDFSVSENITETPVPTNTPSAEPTPTVSVIVAPTETLTPAPEAEQEVVLNDVSGKTCFSGTVSEKQKEINYQYTPSVSGIYRFDTDRSAGDNVWVYLYGANGGYLDSGFNGLTVDLEREKDYIIQIQYDTTPCEYTVKIGVPQELRDITGESMVAGNLYYIDQEDQYTYTAEVSGVYRFETDRSAGDDVWFYITGKNGNYIEGGINEFTVTLEQGQQYILCVQYYGTPCEYSVMIGVPREVQKITRLSTVTGELIYKDQENRYEYYSSVCPGIYYLDADCNVGSNVRICVYDRNGNEVASDYNNLKVELEESKTYIIAVCYVDNPCEYTLNLGVPRPILDISESGCAVGDITYKYQRDTYSYTAEKSGLYTLLLKIYNDNSVWISIKDKNGEIVGESEGSVAVNFVMGETYTINVEQYDGLGDYMISLEWRKY